MKNSFVLYTDYLQQIELLNNEQRGVLLTAVMKYASGLEMPEMDGITMMAFSFIKSNMDKDNEKYERTVKARQEAGKSGGRPKNETLITVSGKEIPPGEIDGKHFLYFIYDAYENQYKIGETRNLFARRLGIHRPKSHLQIIDFYIGTVTDCQKYEKEVLHTYKQYSVGGDWFELPEEKVDEILSKYFQKNHLLFLETKGYQNNPDNENDNVNDNVNDLSVGCKQPMCGKAPRNEAEYPYKAICERLNTLSGTAFKDKSKDTRKHIKARFEEGFTLEDFYTVIDKKVAEWRGTDMEKYLRPSTLFGSKFESYLNQCDKPSRETVKGQREYYESDWTELL